MQAAGVLFPVVKIFLGAGLPGRLLWGQARKPKEIAMRSCKWLVLLYGTFPLWTLLENIEVMADSKVPEPADLIVHNAKVVTVDEKFSLAEAVAIRGEHIVAV